MSQLTPIHIDITAMQKAYGLSGQTMNQLTEVCVNAVSAAVYATWEAEAKRNLRSTAPIYVQGLIKVDRGKLEKAIVLTGILPNMLENGATPFDIKEGFKKSSKVKYTIAKFTKRGKQIRQGGDWYLTIPFRIGVPGTLGQAGFTGQMPDEVYQVMRKKAGRLTLSEIPSPYDQRRKREAIQSTATTPYYAEYVHKNSIYEGMVKRTAQYEKVSQNTYGTFRRAGANSDPLSWIHRGLVARNFAQAARNHTDVDTIVHNECVTFLEKIL